MALRTFIRLLALALATAPLSFLLWDVAGPLPLLVGLGLVGLSLLYLVLLAGGGNLTRWQFRYHLKPGDGTERLEEILHFLAEKTAHFVVEANAQGLFLELPVAFDRYAEAQLPKALPELRMVRDKTSSGSQTRGSSFLSVGAPTSDALRWATEGEGRHVRLHVHQGPYATFIAQIDGPCPPGRWLRLPLPRLLKRLWQHLPLWDELSDGVRLSSLFPLTDDGAVYSSRSCLLQLAPPDDYTPDPTGRVLGQSTAGRPLILGYGVPLHTVGAPSSFLVRKALDDLATGRTVVVISPHRRVLGRIAQQAGDTPVHWLDVQNSRRSAHLAIAIAAEWATVEIETILQGTQTFLADLGLDVDLPAVGDFTHRLLHALAEFARQTGQDLTFTDLYAVSQSTQALRAFLTGTPGEAARGVLAQLDDDGGYVQAVTILSAIHNALKPLGTGPSHMLCQPPFLNFGHVLDQKALLLVPMTNTDFPEHDRLLSAMLDLTLRRVLASCDNVSLALHLHDPHFYRSDHGKRWIDAARQDPRISLLSDVHDPDAYSQVRDEQQESQVIFRCSEALASRLIAEWSLPASVSEFTELPTGTAIARLPGMAVTLVAPH